MADWTANSSFGSLSATREPIFRSSREAPARQESLRAERASAEEAPRLGPGVAALAEYNAGHEGPLAKARMILWAGGGALSLLLVAGVGVWGYKLILREVLGLPVVEAQDGPMRIIPADPGGEVVPQQGLAVNAIPAAGTVAPPSDVLVLAPPTPGLAEEDLEVVQTLAEADEVMPTATETAPPRSVASMDALAVVAPEAEPILPDNPEPVATAPLGADPVAPTADPAAVQTARLVAALLPNDRPMTREEILAFADQIAAEAAPLQGTSAEAAGPETTQAERPIEMPVAGPVLVIPPTVPGVTAVFVPPVRPATLRTATAPAPAAEAAKAAPVEVASAAGIALTSDLPSGTNLVQLGAFDSPEIAASEWDRLQDAFGEFLGGRERVIQETQSGGRTLYRLRAMGFEDRAAARILCAALTAEDAACIPVTVD